MPDLSTIQDYSLIDSYLSKSLDNYNKQLFGDYDEKTGYFKQMSNQQEEEIQSQDEQDDQISNDDIIDNSISEQDIYNSLFSPDESSFNDPGEGGGGSPSKSNTAPFGFRTFATPQEGRKALINQLNIYQSGKSKTGIKPTSTLLEAMSIYAPAFDKNDPAHYADVVAKALGVTINTPISKLDKEKWADAITKMEGNKRGNNPGNLRLQAGGSSFNPNLAETDKGFQNWYLQNTLEGKNKIPYSESLDYDYYSFYRNGEYKNYKGGHFPDTYKRSNHSTFSDESIYSVPENTGGHWNGNKFNRRRVGGATVANTKRQQYIGLNNNSLDELILPLSGENTIRGLDSGEPVLIQDETGNTKVLYGPSHTSSMKGIIYEKRLKK